MHIVHVTPRYLPARGGAEIYLAELSRRLVAEGHQVSVVTTTAHEFEYLWDKRAKSFSLGQEMIDGVSIYRLPVAHLPANPTSYHGLRRLLWLMARLPQAAHSSLMRRLMGQLAYLAPRLPSLYPTLTHLLSTGIDLLTGTNIAYEGMLIQSQKFAALHQIPFVMTPLTHLGAGPTPASDPLSAFYTMPHQIQLVTASSGLVAMTDAEKRFYVGHRFNPEKVTVAGPGIEVESNLDGDPNLARAKFNLTGPIVLAVGTISVDKGAVMLIEAFEHLYRSNKEVNLVLAGHLTEEVQDRLSQIPQRANLHLLGKISDEDKRHLLAAADLFALPSRVESFGIVYLEAWANKLPVIAANSWGVSDIVQDQVNGRLVPFGDVEQLARLITALLDDPAERERLGQNGFEYLQAVHRWPRKIENLLTLYRSCVTESSLQKEWPSG